MNLPSKFEWLPKEPGPKMLLEALSLYGIKEGAGSVDNPTILAWARECNVPYYTHDEIPWCGLFMAVVAKRAGKDFPAIPVRAKSWAAWGKCSPQPKLGDVLVFSRDGGGHVGLYVGEDHEAYYVLGGNQKDSVCITGILKIRCVASRNLYKVGTPTNVRRVYIDKHGERSTNEK